MYVSAAKLTLGKESKDYYIIEAIHDLSQDVRYSHQQKVSSLAFLSTSLAHEMKNNLGAIRLIIEGILSDNKIDKQLSDANMKYLMMAYKQLEETIQTPERLLRLAQYSDKDIEDINVGMAVKDIMLMTDYEAKRNGIECEQDIEPDLSFSGNESDFKMTLLNLFQNAIKAMPDGGKLQIIGYKEKNNAVILVRDTGIGIKQAKLKQIFEPFYSANDTMKGSGLGLAIVKSLVTKARGRISVKSKLGQGTEFKIKIPQTRRK